MDELVKAVRHFIMRDVIFVLGGSVILISFVYLFHALGHATPDLEKIPNVLYLLGAGFAYFIGYVIQDLFCLTPLLTVNYPEPNRLIRFLYHQHERKPWEPIKDDDFDRLDAQLLILGTGNEYLRANLERIISLKQIGTTMVPCCLVSDVFILVTAAVDTIRLIPEIMKCIPPCNVLGTLATSNLALDIALFFGLLFMVVALYILTWIKIAQARRYMYKLSLVLKPPSDQAHTKTTETHSSDASKTSEEAKQPHN